MTASGPTRLAGVVEMTPRGPMLLEADGMRWRRSPPTTWRRERRDRHAEPRERVPLPSL